MAFLAVDKDGEEAVFSDNPIRDISLGMWRGECVYLPIGSIMKLIRRKMSWADEPAELTERPQEG